MPIPPCHTCASPPIVRNPELPLDALAVPASHIAIALAAAAAIAALARWRGLLDTGGAVATALLGPAIVATGGWWLGVVLVAFFLSSSLLPDPAGEAPARTWQQALANGGPALAFAAASTLTARDALLAGATATIAAATADTWATEVGRAFGGTPRSVRTGRHVAPGTSGAVSAVGSLASLAGGTVIALVALTAAPLSPTDIEIEPGTAFVIAAAGALGSAIDSLLGATAQARFACTVCGHHAESGDAHLPGHPMRHVAGIRWLTNSGVNLASTLLAGIAAATLVALMN